MSDFAPQLDWIDRQRHRMAELVEIWAGINSGSYNRNGLMLMTQELQQAFDPVGGKQQVLELEPQEVIDAAGRQVERPLGQALRIIKRPDAARRVLLCIHMDTVYGPDHPFQHVERSSAGILRGPGVTDAKGGLAVMLVALEAIERSGAAESLGWEVLINPDEEVGSPGSAPLLAEVAQRNDIGLLFEPALEDGALAAARKGSGNFTVVVSGVAAHAGREFEAGRNAITALAELIRALDAINGELDGLTVNIGRIEGGGPVNIVPDVAIARFNVRCVDVSQQQFAQSRIAELIEQTNDQDGISARLYGDFTAPPKPFDNRTLRLFEHLAACGKQLGQDIRWRSTGGVCDGNRLAAAGLANVDTLGPRGGLIHSDNEFLELDSLTERAKLTALFLYRFAAGEMNFLRNP